LGLVIGEEVETDEQGGQVEGSGEDEFRHTCNLRNFAN
jgi:hypothetical protein